MLFPYPRQTNPDQGVLCEPFAIGVLCRQAISDVPGNSGGVLAPALSPQLHGGRTIVGARAVYITADAMPAFRSPEKPGAAWAGNSRPGKDMSVVFCKSNPLGLGCGL